MLTAIFGLRRARRELTQLEAKQATLHQSRRRHLITLGRIAAAAENLQHPSLGRTREQIAVVEDDRVRYTGQVTAADTELGRVSRDREGRAQQHTADLAGIDAELAELAKKLEPSRRRSPA